VPRQLASQFSPSIATGGQKATYPGLAVQSLDTLTPNLSATLESLKDTFQLTGYYSLPFANQAARIVDQQQILA
jgi:hypothetical protein